MHSLTRRKFECVCVCFRQNTIYEARTWRKTIIMRHDHRVMHVECSRVNRLRMCGVQRVFRCYTCIYSCPRVMMQTIFAPHFHSLQSTHSARAVCCVRAKWIIIIRECAYTYNATHRAEALRELKLIVFACNRRPLIALFVAAACDGGRIVGGGWWWILMHITDPMLCDRYIQTRFRCGPLSLG